MSSIKLEIFTRYRKATTTGQGQIVVSHNGHHQSVPFNYAADDAHRDAIVTALGLTPAQEASLIEAEPRNERVYRWEIPASSKESA